MALLLFIVLMFFPSWTSGQEVPSVVINEIAWMGTPVPGVEEKQWWRYEWFELYNNADVVGALDGWALELYRGEELYFKIPLSGTVAPYGYFLVGSSDKISGVDVNYSNLGGKFLNTGMRVLLKDNAGNIVDEVDPVRSQASNSWSGGDNKTKQTMERVVGSVVGSDPASVWQTSKEPGGTPKASNSAGIVKLNSIKEEVNLNLVKGEEEQTEKDPSDSSGSFQSRVPVVNPITLLAGLLALGFSGVLLLVKRSLVLRLRSGHSTLRVSDSKRQEHRRS